MILRPLLLLAAAAASAALPSLARAQDGAPAAGITIVHVFTGWRDAASFKHISEYFDGKENTRGETMLRTQPGQRAGFYFLVRAVNPGAPLPVKLSVQLVMPAGTKATEFSFTTDLKSGDSVVNLGLTGADWPDAKTNPVAWKLEVRSADGRVLGTEKSYLWEKPATP